MCKREKIQQVYWKSIANHLHWKIGFEIITKKNDMRREFDSKFVREEKILQGNKEINEPEVVQIKGKVQEKHLIESEVRIPEDGFKYRKTDSGKKKENYRD